MKCPFCGKSGCEVLESRSTEGGDSLRRRRKCAGCGKRFTTIEKVKDSVISVVKKDGRREPFDTEKLRKGLSKAVQKRPVSWQQINLLVNEIEHELKMLGEHEVSSSTIGQIVLDKIYNLDRVAWLRFASVYFAFEDISDFKKMIKLKKL